jgi:uncharacterized membrane-anchored protein
MKKYKWPLIFLNLLIVVSYMMYAVCAKENTISKGTLALLELAPVDPRSLMQGDFMQLNYAISQQVSNQTPDLDKRGYIVVTLDKNGLATYKRWQHSEEPNGQDEYLIKYTKPDYRGISIGAESFFFQEGHGEKYEKAKYGGLKLGEDGSSVLVGLYDENRKMITDNQR